MPNIDAIVVAFFKVLSTRPILLSVARYTTGAISLNLSYEADSLPPINIISGSHSITASISASFIVPRFFMLLFSE